jgi:DNA anti-recombination protein RmuC
VDDENLEVTSETIQNRWRSSDLNTELEEIDGELTSLLTEMNKLNHV